MEKSDFVLKQRLAVIYEGYLENLDAAIAEIRETWHIARHTRCNSIQMRRLANLAQELEARSVPFNLIQIADQAHKLYSFLSFITGDDKQISIVHRRQVELLIDSLESSVSNTSGALSQVPPAGRWEPAGITPDLDRQTARILILDTGRLWAEPLFDYLQTEYRTLLFSDYRNFSRAVAEFSPKLIITDTPLFNHGHRQSQDPAAISFAVSSAIPIIFVAPDDTLETRLLAVRSGATEFVTLPLAVDKVAEKARDLLSGVPEDPFRVMIIDTDAPMARFHALILGQEGMNVTLADDPFRALEMIRIHRPELILMNVSMPLLSGIELTRIIRQEESFAGIAIIYISSDINFKNHLVAITSGGDEIIDIPVAPEYLVATIHARVSRARTLTSINHDLNTTIRELQNQQFALNQHAIVSITNINGTIIYVNKKFCDISGYTKTELIGKDHRMLDSGYHEPDFFRELWTTIEAGNVWRGEVCNRKKNGGLYWVNMTIVPFIDEQGRPYQYVAINSDITPRKNVEKDLLVARDQAINASQAKSEFLSRMSHELRTPLNAVLGFSQLLESSRDRPLTDAQLQYLSEIHNAGNHLLQLINDALDLSRIESNQVLIESINIPLAAFLDECAALILPFAQKKKLDIITPYRQGEELMVFADPLRLKQVLVNLLSNAVKYNQLSGTIVINAFRKESDVVLIEVADSGRGIDRVQLGLIFQPFARLPQHRNEEGAGIGLALSKRLTELMGGRIGARSTIGAGTTFWIEIPGGERFSAASVQPVSQPLPPETAAPAPNTPVALLYIEDNDANLLLVREILKDRPNVQLLHSYTVKSGIEAAAVSHPRLILMDLDLPDMSGLEGIRLLRNDPELAAIPVIAVSAYADRENIQRTLQLGFTGYIAKPVDINGLLAQIDRYCG